jgi:hypothetical protein
LPTPEPRGGRCTRCGQGPWFRCRKFALLAGDALGVCAPLLDTVTKIRKAEVDPEPSPVLTSTEMSQLIERAHEALLARAQVGLATQDPRAALRDVDPAWTDPATAGVLLRALMRYSDERLERATREAVNGETAALGLVYRVTSALWQENRLDVLHGATHAAG